MVSERPKLIAECSKMVCGRPGTKEIVPKMKKNCSGMVTEHSGMKKDAPELGFGT